MVSQYIFFFFLLQTYFILFCFYSYCVSQYCIFLQSEVLWHHFQMMVHLPIYLPFEWLLFLPINGASLVAQTVKNLPAMQETWVWSPVRKIPWRREWLPTAVFLPGEFRWQMNLVGYSPWGLKESDMIEQIRISTWLHFSLDKDLLLVIFCIGLLPQKNLLFFNQEISLFCFYFWKLFILTAYRIPGWQFPFSSTLSSFVLFSWWDASSLSIMAFSHSKMWFSLLWPSLRHCYLQEFGLPVSELWLLYTLPLSPRWSWPCTSWLGKSPEHQWWDSTGELQPIETILQSRNHEDFESNIKYLKWSRLRNHATLSWVH